MLKNFEANLRNSDGAATRLLDIFIILNLAFLALDVYIAPAVGGFTRTVEWLPIYFSLIAFCVLACVLITGKLHWLNWCRTCFGWSAICIGIAGMLFHLSSHFFSDASLKNIVYAAPFVAPLAYTGIGLLLLLNNLIPDSETEWVKWVLLLALCGWCGNFILSVLDHAQNGFFNITEWLPVITSALAASSLGTLLCMQQKQRFIPFCITVLCLNIIVGVAGFFLHLVADLHVPALKETEKLLYGAPLFAPLLFPNLSLLALLGIWKTDKLYKMYP